jgi:SAM-dependent methyltransferase
MLALPRQVTHMASVSPDQIRAIYEKYAREWDADRNGVGWNDKRWHDRFLALLNVGAGILDLGCGSGFPVAYNLVQHGFRVTGVDASPTMISLCRERMPDQEWVVADMRNVSFARKFEGILGWDSCFFLEPDEQRRMFEMFAAHACPSCVLMFNTGPQRGEAIGSYRGEPLYHASLGPSEYRALLKQSGFELIDHIVEDPLAGGRTVWLARRAKTKPG